MFDLTRALAIAQTALDDLAHEPTCGLTTDEMNGLSFAVQTSAKAIDLIAGECLFPADSSVASLPEIRDLHQRTIAALRSSHEMLGKTRPLTHATRRAIHGVRFIVEAVLFALEAANPEDPANVRYTLAA